MSSNLALILLASLSGSLFFQFKGSASIFGSFSTTGEGIGLKPLGLEGFSSSTTTSSSGGATTRASFFLAASLAWIAFNCSEDIEGISTSFLTWVNWSLVSWTTQRSSCCSLIFSWF